MKCPSCGALAEVPGHYSWCEIQPPDSAPEERERRTPEWYASEQVKAHELEGACRIARDLGYATGHADTYDDLLQHVREQRNQDTRTAAWVPRSKLARARAEVVEKVLKTVDANALKFANPDSFDAFRDELGSALVSPTTEEK